MIRYGVVADGRGEKAVESGVVIEADRIDYSDLLLDAEDLTELTWRHSRFENWRVMVYTLEPKKGHMGDGPCQKKQSA